MSDGFDKSLREFADEANENVDFEALRERILKAREEEKTQNVVKPRFGASRLRGWGLLAACLLLFIGGSIVLGEGISSKKADDAPQLMMNAAAGAVEESADAAMPEAALFDMEEAQFDAAEAPAEAMVTTSVTDENDSGKSEPAPALAGRATENAPDGMPSGMEEPYLVLVNRNNPIPEGKQTENLSSVDEAELSNITLKKTGMLAEATALSALSEMLRAAEEEGVTGFYLISAYRSFDEQNAIWQRKLASDPHYGENGAPVSSMPPGQSEHQTGLAFDITSLGHPSMSEGYAGTEQAQWLAENCADYGFILRYPKGKENTTGVVFEPWHFRYVGVDTAQYLTESGLVLEEREYN